MQEKERRNNSCNSVDSRSRQMFLKIHRWSPECLLEHLVFSVFPSSDQFEIEVLRSCHSGSTGLIQIRGMQNRLIVVNGAGSEGKGGAGADALVAAAFFVR